MQKLILLPLFLLLFFPVRGQFVIENSLGDPSTSPEAEDVNVCFDQGATLAFRVIAAGNSTNPVLDIELATGRIYGGNISVLSSSGGYTVGPNIGTPENPQFQITGDFSTGDFAEFSVDVGSNCAAINQSGLTHTISIGMDSEPSTTHDALFLTLTITDLNTITVPVGQAGTLTGRVVGGGNGCAEEVVFRLSDDAGLTTTDLRFLDAGGGNPISLTADSVVGSDRYYTLDAALISRVGNLDNCLDALEMLPFARDVVVSSCEVATSYEATWGCFGESCISSGQVPQQVNIPAGIPNIQVTNTSIIQSSNLCPDSPATVEFTLTNNGTGAGTAFNVVPNIRTDANQTTEVTRIGQSFTNFVLSDGMGGFISVPTTGGIPNNGVSRFPILEADFSGFSMDPDGPGGLDDIDGDGQYDDLPLGESITYRVDWNYLCQFPEIECGPNHSGGPGTCLGYEDQCGTELRGAFRSAGGFTNRFWTATSQSPNDVEDGGTFDVQYFWTADLSPANGGLVNCPDGYLRHVISIPSTDFSYVPGSAAYNVGTNDGIIVRDSVSPDGSTLIIDVNRSMPNNRTRIAGGNIEFQLLFNCGSGGFYGFEVEQQFICDESCNTCIEPLTCEPFGINAFCPDPCPVGGLTIVASSGLRRITTGFASPTDETRVDLNTLTDIQRQYGMPHDTFVATYNGVNFSDSAGVFYDNGHFRLTYGQLGGGDLLDPGTAEIEIFRNGVSQTTCTAPPTESRVNGRHIINYDFASCGYTFGMGDSVSLAAPVAIVKNNALTRNPQPINTFRSIFYSITPLGDTVTCSFRTGDLYLHAPVETYRSSLGNYSRTGCGEYNPQLAVQWGAGPFDPYPNEIRPYSRPDSLRVQVMGGDRFTATQSWPLNIGNFSDDPGPSNLQIDLRDYATWSADSTEVLFINDGSWPLADLFGSTQAYRLQPARIINSCQTGGPGTATVIWEFFSTGYYYAYDEVCYEPFDLVEGEPESVRSGNQHILPQHDIFNLTGTDLVTSDTATWTVDIRNLTNIPSGYIFLAFPDLSTTNIDVIQVRDVAADTLIPLLPYSEGDWVRVSENFGAAETREIELTAIVSACEEDEVDVLLGFDCADYPTDPTTYPCELDQTTLPYRVLPSRVQIELAQEPTPFPICTELMDTITITSALDGYITDINLVIPLPEGLVERDLRVQVEYPANSGNLEDFPLVLNSGPTGDTALVDVMLHTAILNQNGVPGIRDAATLDDAQAQVYLNWISNCDFLSGTTYAPIVFANRPCGNPAIDDGVSTMSDPLLVQGASPPFISPIDLDLSIDTVKGCQPVAVDIDIFIAVGNTTQNDTVYITLPQGTIYEPGSLQCNLTGPMSTACPTLIEVREEEDRPLVVLSLPEGVTDGTQIPLSLEFSAPDATLCEEEGEIKVEVVTSAQGIFCPSTGMDCEGISVLNGSSRDTIFFEKPEVRLDAISVCRDEANFTVAGQVSSMAVDVPAGDSLEVEVYCGSNLATTIYTFAIQGPITAGTPVAFEESFLANCAANDDLYFLIDPDSGNCICSPIDTLVATDEAPQVTLGEPLVICQTVEVTLSDLMPTIAGSTTSGTWSTSGDGTFIPDNNLLTANSYQPGPMDITNGAVTLRLTSASPPGACPAGFSEVEITILKVDCGSFLWDGSNN